MRVFVCSDIHANIRAFDAVLEDYSRSGPYRFLFLGDAVGYGANPGKVLDRLVELPRASLLVGNHDWALLDPSERENMNELAAAAMDWTEKHLEDRHRLIFIERFSLTGGGGGYIAAHATPVSIGSWDYIFTGYAAGQVFDKKDFDLCFVGHTHIPIVYNSKGEVTVVPDGGTLELEPGTRYIVNPGSVGQPRDGDSRASYCVFDPSKRTITFHRKEYDVMAEASDILDSGLPPYFAERITVGA